MLTSSPSLRAVSPLTIATSPAKDYRIPDSLFLSIISTNRDLTTPSTTSPSPLKVREVVQSFQGSFIKQESQSQHHSVKSNNNNNLNMHPITQFCTEETGISVVSVLFEGFQYEVYFKKSGDLRQFLGYFSQLKKEVFKQVYVCMEYNTKEILPLTMPLINHDKLFVELIPASLVITKRWIMEKDRYYMDGFDSIQSAVWVRDIAIIEMYKKIVGSKQAVAIKNEFLSWYFDYSDMITAITKTRVMSEFDKLYPENLDQDILNKLAKDELAGYKIYYTFNLFLEFYIGIHIRSLQKFEVKSKNIGLYKQVRQLPSLIPQVNQSLQFMSAVGFHNLAVAVYTKLSKYMDIIRPISRYTEYRENEFLLQYKFGSMKNKSLYLDLIKDKLEDPFRAFKFLKDVHIYEFLDYTRPFTEILDDLGTHNLTTHTIWLFPTAQTCSEKEISLIKQSKASGKNLLKGYRKYMGLFSLEIDKEYEVVKNKGAIDSFKHPSHNLAVINRVLDSLSVTGFRIVADKYLKFLQQIVTMEGVTELVAKHLDQSQWQSNYGLPFATLKKPHIIIRSESEACWV